MNSPLEGHNKPPREEPLPEGRLYVVGDIHGCASELHCMLDFLELSESVGDEDAVVFIGDYIDRGDASMEVVELLLEFQASIDADCYFLKGNHEDMLLDFIDLGGTLGDAWLINGGKTTLESYRINPRFRGEEAQELFPAEHLEFYSSLESCLVIGNYVCVHAGLNPLRDLYTQVSDDLFWIREEFISNVHNFEKTVIFGHTPFEDIFFDLPYKIGLDTGLVYGNALSCIELREQRVFQIEKGAQEIELFSFREKGAPEDACKALAAGKSSEDESEAGSTESGEDG